MLPKLSIGKFKTKYSYEMVGKKLYIQKMCVGFCSRRHLDACIGGHVGRWIDRIMKWTTMIYFMISLCQKKGAFVNYSLLIQLFYSSACNACHAGAFSSRNLSNPTTKSPWHYSVSLLPGSDDHSRADNNKL